jgi:hypothetical protein
MEERADGILLRPARHTPVKLSWEDTAREMAAATEDWNEWSSADGDGLAAVPWSDPKRVAEPQATYRRGRKATGR